MKREQIERLAMDREAGELNADAEVLFDQYLRGNPDAKSWADEIAGAYTKTEAAIATRTDDVESSAPALALCRTTDLNPGRWSVLGRAAVVLFAVLIGVGVGRWSQSPDITSKPAAVTAQSTPAQESLAGGLPGSEGGFWRGRALALLQTRPYRARQVTHKREGFWNRYKPSLKENSYE